MSTRRTDGNGDVPEPEAEPDRGTYGAADHERHGDDA